MESLSESVIPWLDKVMLQDRRLAVLPENWEKALVPGSEMPWSSPHFENTIVKTDFKSFLLDAKDRPIDFQVSQMMLAIKQLMDVCEKQQIIIEALQAAMKNQFDHKPPTVY